MNIWIEGVDGTGKTTLAKALGDALDVDPLYHVTHDELPDRPYNVIDRHASITNYVYKTALPNRFEDAPAIKRDPLNTSSDLYIYLEHSLLTDYQADDYTRKELAKLNAGYSAYFHKWPCNLVHVVESSNTLRVADYASDPLFKRSVLVERSAKPQATFELKVREILRIIREMERRNHVAN